MREDERLYSLIATCEANGVNPVDYLAHVLIRVQTHPVSRIDELLPHTGHRRNREPSAMTAAAIPNRHEEDLSPDRRP